MLLIDNSGTGKTHLLTALAFAASQQGHKVRFVAATGLIVTSNLPFEPWREVMGSERLTGAPLDRLTRRTHILEANGESYRLKDSRKRVTKTKRTRARKA